MFNNYAIVQGVDHIVPVDIYLPGCPPRPEMLLNAILTLHEQIQNTPLGVNRGDGGPRRRGGRARRRRRRSQMKGLLRVSDEHDGRRRGAKPGDATTGAQPTSEAAPRPAASDQPARGTPPRSSTSGTGMFGAHGAGRHLRATAAWSARSRCPAPAERPYGG